MGDKLYKGIWSPRDWVALVLALTLFCSFMGHIVMEMLQVQKPTESEVDAWKDLFMVLLGALSGYIGGQYESEFRKKKIRDEQLTGESKGDTNKPDENRE